jgi:hypothetical protein
VKDVIEPLKLSSSLNGDKVNRLLDNAQYRWISRGIPAKGAERLFAQKETSLAQSHFLRGLLQRGAEGAGEISIVRDKVIGKPRGGLFTNRGKLGELLYQTLESWGKYKHRRGLLGQSWHIHPTRNLGEHHVGVTTNLSDRVISRGLHHILQKVNARRVNRFWLDLDREYFVLAVDADLHSATSDGSLRLKGLGLRLRDLHISLHLLRLL